MRLLKIKLRRVGRWKKPVYAVVIVFKDTAARGGRAFEKLGFYSPASNPKFFFINFYRTAYWLTRGALLTNTLGVLLGKIAPSKKIK